MTDYPGLPYKELLQETIKDGINAGIKKRRKLNSPEIIEVEDSSRSSSHSDSDSDDFEDVALNVTTNSAIDRDGNEHARSEPLTFKLDSDQKQKQPPAKKVTFVSKEERETRRQKHKQYLLLSIIHGAIRNHWLNDYTTGQELKRLIPSSVLILIGQDANSDNNLVKSRRFLDGLSTIVKLYAGKFRVISQGLIRKEWNELTIKQTNTDIVTAAKFRRLVKNLRGSRDIGAQGFVALLRSIGLNARLIFSLQPPDFTNITYSSDKGGSNEENSQRDYDLKSSHTDVHNGRNNSNKSKLLSQFRSDFKVSKRPEKTKPALIDSEFPIFWVEVWNKYAQKWVSIDPIVNSTLEYVSLRSKSKFEPPLTDVRNQLTYVIAFDRLGGVRDVTRRYSKLLNAKTSKKRITSVSDDERHWYERVLRCSSSSIRRNLSKLDILELKEFHNRDLAEGMPNNLADFKNHPAYVLESQVRKNEIIYPKEECGSFRTGRGNSSQPVFKRANVHQLKSSRAWYMRGRVLRVGQQPMKIRHNPKIATEESEVRLYCEFQTQLYIPPKIENGKVPKNAYGNIDVYVPSMLPENGILLSDSAERSITLMEKAARILGIDYAKAVVAFDFSGKKKVHGVPKVKEGGIVIFKDYKEALMLVLENLIEEERQTRVEKAKMNSLNNWKFFLLRLRISKRLDKMHGSIDILEEKDEEDEEEEEDEEDEEDEDENDDDDDDDDDDDGDDEEEKFEDEEDDYEEEYEVKRSEDNNDNEDRESDIFLEVTRSNNDITNNSRNTHFQTVENRVQGGQELRSENNSMEVDDEYDTSEDEEFLGGFLLDDDDKNGHQKVQVERESPESMENENDLPDELFTEDENGDLVYMPDREEIGSTNRDEHQSTEDIEATETFDFDYSESD